MVNGGQRQKSGPELWKCRDCGKRGKPKAGFPLFPPAPWESRPKAARFPQPRRSGPEKWKPKTRFPTFPSHFAITTAVLFSLIPAAFGCQNRRWAAEKGAILQPPAALIFRIILYWNQNSISGSFFDWKMLRPVRDDGASAA